MLVLPAVLSVLPVLSTTVYALVVTSDASSIAGGTFDYVVVGGGTAGLAVASRLAENPNIAILVIEAGPDAQNDTDVNDPAQSTVAAAKYNWSYVTAPQSVGGLAQSLTQGKVLGGSSSINGQDWNRGTISQYNSLEELGNPGWNWVNLLGYMQKSEHFHIPNANQIALGAEFLPQFHGFEGPINSGFPQPYIATAPINFLIQAFQKVIPGLQRNPDPAHGTSLGIFGWFFSIKPAPDSDDTPGGNTRSSAAAGYIYPFENTNTKQGLTILTGHLGSRIIWSNSSASSLATATGVEFITTPSSNDSSTAAKLTVNVKREVIVSCGAIGSPHFLELSGIGDPSILQSASIPTQVNLTSVGTNLQDQGLNILLYAINSSVPFNEFNTANTPGTPAAAYLDLPQLFPAAQAEDIGEQLLDSIGQRAAAIVQSGAFTSQTGMEKILALQARDITQLNAPIIEVQFGISANTTPPIAGFVIWVLIPQWRGTVHVTSSDPAVHPALNPNYFTTAFDLDIQLAALKIGRKVFSTSPMAEFVSEEVLPGLGIVPQNATDEQWLEFLKGSYEPVLHPLGSVSMLPREDGGAVDSKLKVYGTSNVRVVDSSIIPIQLSAHPSGSVYGVAEKAADIIKSTWT